MSDGTVYPDFDWHQRWKESQERIAELKAKLDECKQVSNAHCLQADNYRVKLAELREAARDQLPDVSMRSDVHDKLAALLEVNEGNRVAMAEAYRCGYEAAKQEVKRD